MLNHVQTQIAVIEAMSIIRHYIQSHQAILLICLVDCVTVKSSNDDDSNALEIKFKRLYHKMNCVEF
jgi:hypothetical protein